MVLQIIVDIGNVFQMDLVKFVWTIMWYVWHNNLQRFRFSNYQPCNLVKKAIFNEKSNWQAARIAANSNNYTTPYSKLGFRDISVYAEHMVQFGVEEFIWVKVYVESSFN